MSVAVVGLRGERQCEDKTAKVRRESGRKRENEAEKVTDKKNNRFTRFVLLFCFCLSYNPLRGDGKKGKQTAKRQNTKKRQSEERDTE